MRAPARASGGGARSRCSSTSAFLRRGAVFSIPGTPPRLVDIQPGCRFAPRCPLSTIECRTWETELIAVGHGEHLVRCRRHDDARRPEAWPSQHYESE